VKLGHLALGQRADLRAGERHLLMQCRDVLLVAAQPVQALRGTGG
jgi:hypothetical protein